MPTITASNWTEDRDMRHEVQNLGLAGTRQRAYKFTYDFAVLGGEAEAKTLKATDGQLPDNLLVTNAWIECETAATSGGAATIMLGVTDDTDALIAATAYTDNKFGTPGNLAALTAAIPVKLDGANDVIATIAAAALTAGKFHVYVVGIPGV